LLAWINKSASRVKEYTAPATNGLAARGVPNTTLLATMVRVWDAGFAIAAN
jgi:hypothetical protein